MPMWILVIVVILLLSLAVYHAGRHVSAERGRAGGGGAAETSSRCRRPIVKTPFVPAPGESVPGDCPICLDRFADPPDAELCDLECGHRFHPPCVNDWFVVKDICPVCNFEGSERERTASESKARAA